MNKKLPVLLKIGENLFDEVELKKPSGALLAQTEEDKNRNEYLGMRTLVAGCVESIDGTSQITDPIAIKSAITKMSNKNLEFLGLEIMVDFYNGEDYIEGVYPCPRCGKPHICEKIIQDDLEIDTRDRISDLPVHFMENESELLFDIHLTEPITLESKMGTEEVETITMGFPTAENLIEAINSVGGSNPYKLQYAVYARSIQRVNGEEVDQSWKRSKGVQLFNNCKNVKKDIGQISDIINRYGIDLTVEKTCLECGKVWRPVIRTSNFFGSAPL